MRRVLVMLGACLLALVFAPAVAHAQGAIPGWEVFCNYSHTLNDDPIVHPGQPGVSMTHDFYGNEQANAYSTPRTLRAAASTSNCELSADKASYWAPTLYSSGQQLTPKRLHVYYRWGNVTDLASIQPLPPWAEMIAGDASGQTPIDTAHIGWTCGNQGEQLAAMPKDCRNSTLNEMVLHFFYPNCLQTGANATHPDSYSYSYHGSCASGTTPVVRLSEDFAWAPAVDPSTLMFSSGGMTTAHADFMNGWYMPTMDRLTHDCVQAGVQCGPQQDPS